jgi:predicted nucleotidyltransferase
MGSSSSRPSGGPAAALLPGTRLAVLAILMRHPERSFYLREVVRAAGTGQGAVQRELARLADAGILSRSRVGRQVHYQANRSCPIYPELRALLAKTAGLADVLREALLPLRRAISVAFVFGSQASGRAGPSSDVDLLVAGELDEIELHRAVRGAEAKLERVVNYTLLSPPEFQRRRKERSGFLRQVLDGPKLVLLGDLHED